MRILLFGKNGQVGWELNLSLRPLGEIVALNRDQADFGDPESLRSIVRETQPDVIVNAAAYTAVDKAEEEEGLALTVNGDSPRILAEECSRINSLLVHYSTDYVFDGAKNCPYTETDKPEPLNVYGWTKLAGETAIQASGCDYLIFRTSWVYAQRGHNFLLTILRLAKEREELNIVADQIGAPTSARLIAEISTHCIEQSMRDRKTGIFASGLYHLTASGYTSWRGFAEEIVKIVNTTKNYQLAVKEINGIATDDYPTAAARPRNSRLALDKLQERFSVEVPSWYAELKQCLKEVD